MKTTDRQLARWEKMRKMGRTRYVWLVGVLGWGVATGSTWAVTMAAVQGWDRLPTLLTLALIGFPIGGYFFGAWTWKVCEAQYQKALAEKERES
ncbi:MAG TPA: hypothetical protein VM529_05630 [Gemmata sp.]|jgi:hypothetical protein|nr:hypothetical protein [Gemmata sp.]